MERILDLGCGTGDTWQHLGLDACNWKVVGLDVQRDRVHTAAQKYGPRGWSYVCGRGEKIPLADESMNGCICNVALPYMRIPQSLGELHRVLVPGGWVKMALHAPEFTWSEFRKSFPKPQQSLFRVFVFLNGMFLHFTGRVIAFGEVAESCQTEAGMRIALRRAGFTAVTFRHEGLRFFADAVKGGWR